MSSTEISQSGSGLINTWFISLPYLYPMDKTLNPRELSKGNYIAFGRKVAKVDEIMRDSIRIVLADGSIISTTYRDVQGLTFTEPLLRGFGFEPFEYKMQLAHHKHFRLDIPVITGLPGFVMEVALYRDRAPEGHYRNGHQRVVQDFHFVHQMQNIYYYATGHDLEFCKYTKE